MVVSFTLPAGIHSAAYGHRQSASVGVELARGIEPPTCGLQNRCSAVELRQRPRASVMVAYFATGKATPARIFRKAPSVL